jgi:hypothetical protein
VWARNDEFSTAHRVDQHGPDSVGVRPNARGLDLNRDFIKTESAGRGSGHMARGQ